MREQCPNNLTSLVLSIESDRKSDREPAGHIIPKIRRQFVFRERNLSSRTLFARRRNLSSDYVGTGDHLAFHGVPEIINYKNFWPLENQLSVKVIKDLL